MLKLFDPLLNAGIRVLLLHKVMFKQLYNNTTFRVLYLTQNAGWHTSLKIVLNISETVMTLCALMMETWQFD